MSRSFPPHSESHEAYLTKIRSIPYLTNEEEYQLAKQWRDQGDKKAVAKLVSSHLRLVNKIAQGYRGYGLPVGDLVSEGHIGIMQAMKHFDPDRGFRFATYAMWWIRASIQEYILNSWSLVKLGTTSAQKKLFFKLRSIKQTLGVSQLSSEHIQAIARDLSVKPDEVYQMEQRMSGSDHSLHGTVNHGGEGEVEWIDWLSDDRENQEVLLLNRDDITKKQDLLNQALGALHPRERTILYDRR
ncbi:MAG: RNA polymerase factor sigma-32, partial [Alphaproteobacteria bacterium]|nr:RNA polymerase factor sigma-32 [Alphaproteobacteria bacterium]